MVKILPNSKLLILNLKASDFKVSSIFPVLYKSVRENRFWIHSDFLLLIVFRLLKQIPQSVVQ